MKNSDLNLPPALALMGPTASGKSRLAVELAQSLDGEIISVDSALVFKGMDIGTAKPTLEERQGVPHHLIDILDPAESYSTGRFQRDALCLMQDITRRGRLPILAGGTMLYFHGLYMACPACHRRTRRFGVRSRMKQPGMAGLSCTPNWLSSIRRPRFVFTRTTRNASSEPLRYFAPVAGR